MSSDNFREVNGFSSMRPQMSELQSVAERLAWAMKRRRKDNPAVAGAVGVTSGTVSKWKGGQKLDAENLSVVARFLGLREAWLQFGDGRPFVDEPEQTGKVRETSAPYGASAPDLSRRIRIWLVDFYQLLRRADVPEGSIEWARGLLERPGNFAYEEGGSMVEFPEDEAFDDLRVTAEIMILKKLRRRGYKLPAKAPDVD